MNICIIPLLLQADFFYCHHIYQNKNHTNELNF